MPNLYVFFSNLCNLFGSITIHLLPISLYLFLSHSFSASNSLSISYILSYSIFLLFLPNVFSLFPLSFSHFLFSASLFTSVSFFISFLPTLHHFSLNTFITLFFHFISLRTALFGCFASARQILQRLNTTNIIIMARKRNKGSDENMMRKKRSEKEGKCDVYISFLLLLFVLSHLFSLAFPVSFLLFFALSCSLSNYPFLSLYLLVCICTLSLCSFLIAHCSPYFDTSSKLFLLICLFQQLFYGQHHSSVLERKIRNFIINSQKLHDNCSNLYQNTVVVIDIHILYNTKFYVHKFS